MSEEWTMPEDRRRAAYSALTDVGINSPGPELTDLADSVLVGLDEAFEYADDPLEIEDRLHEVADGAVPVYTGDIMEAISEDWALASSEPEVGPAFDGSPTPVNIAAGNLYDLATQIAHAEFQRRVDALEEDEEE